MKELELKEMKEISGGILGALGIAIGIVLGLGEIAEEVWESLAEEYYQPNCN